MRRLITAGALVVVFSIAGESWAYAEDFGKDALKGVTSVKMGRVTIDPEAQVRLSLTTEQLRSMIRSTLRDGGLRVVRRGDVPTVDTTVKLTPLPVKTKVKVKVVVSERPLVTKEQEVDATVTVWMYRVDTSVNPTLRIDRPVPLLPEVKELRPWRRVDGGLLLSNFDEGIKRILLRDQMPRLLKDWKAVNNLP